jgi:hypothetical protein
MTPILIIAGTLAALILFRWARTLLIFGIAGVVLWSLGGCEAQRLIFPTPSQQSAESGRLSNQLNINSARMAADVGAWVDERKRQDALIVRSPAEKQRNAEQNAANAAREAEITECTERVFRGVPQRYSGQFYELCASHGRGPFWAYDR